MKVVSIWELIVASRPMSNKMVNSLLVVFYLPYRGVSMNILGAYGNVFHTI